MPKGYDGGPAHIHFAAGHPGATGLATDSSSMRRPPAPNTTSRCAPASLRRRMDHLALVVSDQERSQRFYETYCGFGAEPARRYDDGTLMPCDGTGFALALGLEDRGFKPHFGVGLDDPEAVRSMAGRLEADGVEIVERWDEPDCVSVKCRDPDRHIVEFSWETT